MNSLKFLIFIILFLILPNISEAATRTISDAGGNWNSTGAWVEGVVPTISDDVVAQGDGTSGNLTINAAASCRSINLANYTGTLNHDAGITLTIGDGTAGPSNVALYFPASGWLYTIDNVRTSAITFASTTTATPQTVNFATTTGDVTFGSVNNGWWQYTASHTMGATAYITFTRGILDTNGQSISTGFFVSNATNIRTLTLGSSSITVAGTGTYSFNLQDTNLTMTANTATVYLGQAAASVSLGDYFNFNGLSFEFSGSGTASLLCNGSTLANLSRIGTASKYDSLSIGGSPTITGTLTLQGNSATNRLMVVSNGFGAQRTITNTGATMTWSNVDIQDIKLTTAYDCSAITGLCGDAGGNSGITFTTSETQTWSGTASGNWSTNAWTSRVPLPQDDVVIASAFSPAGRVITVDMPRLGRSIDFTGTTGSPTLTGTQNPNVVLTFGSLNFTGVGSVTITSNWYIEGRGDYTFTTNGVTFNNAFMLNAPGGSLTLMDALNMANILYNQSGTLNVDYNITATRFSATNVTSSITNMGSGTWTLNGSAAAAVWALTGTSAVINAETSTIAITDTGTATKTFNGWNKTYNNIIFAGNNIVVAYSNTFNTMSVNNAGLTGGLRFTAGTTQTVSDFTTNGSAGNLAMASSTSASLATLTKTGGGTICVDYMDLDYINGTPADTWYVGANSTNGGNNTGLTFTGCSSEPSGPNTESRGLTPANDVIRGGFKVRGGFKFR